MIGILALQGAFAEHAKMLAELGVPSKEIRKRSDFTSLDGLILPGGESTVQGKLLKEEGLFSPVQEAIAGGLPVLGTCAGMILLAKKLENDENVYFGALDVTVRRNAYGRQLGSFSADLEIKGIGMFPAVFIRAPYVTETGEAETLAAFEGKTVAVRQGNILATAFHPELTGDVRLHEYFLKLR